MTAIDRVGSFLKKVFFPTYAKIETLERSIAVAQARTFAALSSGGFVFGGSKFQYGLHRGTAQAPILDHWTLRQNARAAYHDTPQAKTLVDRFADIVVDTGLKLEATPKAELLGIDPKFAESWAAQVEESFDSWANSKQVTLKENMNFYQAQRLLEITQHRDGEYFYSLNYSPDRRLINPLQIGFIDPNQIRHSAFTNTGGLFKNDDGIVRDENGKEIAFKIWYHDKQNICREKTLPAYIGNKLYIGHGYQPEYVTQDRGYSRIGHVLQELKNLTDFSLAQVMKAISQSNISIFVEPGEDPSSNPFADIAHGVAAGPIDLSLGTTSASGGAGEAPMETVNYTPLSEATFRQPGSIGVFNLRGKEKLKPFAQTAPSENYDTFTMSFLSYLSASLSIPIEVLLLKFEQNYSASRGALILFWRICQIWRAELASDFLNPVYEAWLGGEIARGRIRAPGWSDPRIRSYWLANNWIGAPMPNIDPMRTARADQVYVDMGAQTLDRVARNLNGSSGKANRQKLAREFAELPIAPWQEKKNMRLE